MIVVALVVRVVCVVAFPRAAVGARRTLVAQLGCSIERRLKFRFAGNLREIRRSEQLFLKGVVLLRGSACIVGAGLCRFFC